MPGGLTFHANIDVIESLGAEKFVYFTKELGQTVSSAELEELAKDSGRAEAGSSGETVVARLDPATRIRESQDAELWADVRKLHIFDPATGRNLTLAAAGADGSAGSAAPTTTAAPMMTAAPTTTAAPTQATAAPTGQAPGGPDGTTAQPAGGPDAQGNSEGG